MPPTLEDEETIVVNDWSRRSTPASMSSAIDPPPTSRVSQTIPPGPHQKRLESPEPDHDEQIDQQFRQSRPRASAPTQEDRLQAMPSVRPLPWRDGVEAGAEVETGGDSRRKQIRFGCLLATRGKVQTPGCLSCENGRGKFRLCIALEGYFKGACASCQLSGRPNRCSIKQEDDDGSPSVITPSGFGSFSESTQATPIGSAGPRKRRRTSEVQREKEAKRQSREFANRDAAAHHPQLPRPPPPPPQWSPAVPHTRQEMQDILQRPWATVNNQSSTAQSSPHGSGSRDIRPQNHNIPSNHPAAGWATINQTQAQPTHPQARYRSQSQPQSQSQPHHQAQTQAQLAIQRLQGEESKASGPRQIMEREGKESTTDDSSGPLIDTLPKNKQRQIYGLVSGLQGGVDHLQRELDSLRKALGIQGES